MRHYTPRRTMQPKRFIRTALKLHEPWPISPFKVRGTQTSRGWFSRHGIKYAHLSGPDALLEQIVDSGWLAILARWAQQTADVALMGEAERALANIDSTALRLRMLQIEERRSRGMFYRLVLVLAHVSTRCHPWRHFRPERTRMQQLLDSAQVKLRDKAQDIVARSRVNLPPALHDRLIHLDREWSGSVAPRCGHAPCPYWT